MNCNQCGKDLDYRKTGDVFVDQWGRTQVSGCNVGQTYVIGPVVGCLECAQAEEQRRGASA